MNAENLIEKIHKFLRKDPQKPNMPHSKGKTLLMEAAGEGLVDCVKTLLQAKVLIDKKDRAGKTALDYCLYSDVDLDQKLSCLRLLIESGANLYKPHDDSKTPLMIAASKCDKHSLDLILELGYRNGPREYIQENVDGNDTRSKTNKTDNTVEKKVDKDDGKDVRGKCGNQEDNDDAAVDDAAADDEYDKYDDDDEEEEDDEDGDENDDDTEDVTGGSFGFELDEITNEYDRYLWENDDVFYSKFYVRKFCTSIDFRDRGYGHTAFQFCIAATDRPVKEKTTCLRLLAEAGVDLKLKNGFEQDPVGIAMEIKDDVETLLCLVNMGCEVNLENAFGNASRSQNLPLMKALLVRGVNLQYTNHMNQNYVHHLVNTTTCNVHSNFVETLRFLVHDLKVDVNHFNEYSSVFSRAYYLFVQGIQFPLHYLMSENMDVNIHRQIKNKLPVLDVREQQKVIIPQLQCAQCLFDYNMPQDLILRFIRVEQNDPTHKWLDNVFSSPQSLTKICKFVIRGLLGKGIKEKVLNLGMPEPLQNVLLLKDLLPDECFV